MSAISKSTSIECRTLQSRLLIFVLNCVIGCVLSASSCNGQERPLIIRGEHSIQLIDPNYTLSVADCQTKIPIDNQAILKSLQKSALEHFINDGGMQSLNDLCKSFEQDLVVFTLAFSNDGHFVAASLVFPGKDELDTDIILDSFLLKVFSFFNKTRIPSWKENSPFVIISFPVRC